VGEKRIIKQLAFISRFWTALLLMLIGVGCVSFSLATDWADYQLYPEYSWTGGNEWIWSVVLNSTHQKQIENIGGRSRVSSIETNATITVTLTRNDEVVFTQTSSNFSGFTFEYPPVEEYDWGVNEITVEWCGQPACANLTIQRWDLSHADNVMYILNPEPYQLIFFMQGIFSFIAGLGVFYIEYKKRKSVEKIYFLSKRNRGGFVE
jgi:hypothetical protein